MRILFEVLERDRFEIYDPCVPAAAEAAKIISASEAFDTVRILKFCPAALQVWDITQEMYAGYQGEYGPGAPLWVKLQPDFENRAAEETKDAREWRDHLLALTLAA